MESKKIHLVCSAGGIKCLSYLGAIQKLKENNITIASVSACSMGTIIAALVCSGMDMQKIEERILNYDFGTLLKKKPFGFFKALFPPFASRKTPNYKKIVTDLLGSDITLGELKIPFYTYTLDMRQNRFLVYSSEHHPDMKLSEAMRIATAIPFYLESYKLGKRILVDASVASESPIWIAANNPGFYPIVVLKPLNSPNAKGIKGLRSFIYSIITSTSISHDYFVAMQTERTINLDINCENLSAFDFGINKDQIEQLVVQGQSAAQKKLMEFNGDFSTVLNYEDVVSLSSTKNFEDKAELLANQMISGFQNEANKRNQIFISYSHDDKKWLDEIKIHLSTVERFTGIKAWDDTAIKPGNEWNSEIQKALISAKVAVFLVTPNFLASEFIQEHEMGYFLEISKKENVPIFWIAVSKSSFKFTPLNAIQCANDPNMPLDKILSEADRNEELTKICKALVELIK